MQLVNFASKVPNSSSAIPSNTLNSHGRGKGRGRGRRFFKPRCQICDQIGHTAKVCYYNSGNSVFHNAGLPSTVDFHNAFGPTQSHLVQHAFTPTSGVFGPYSSKVDFNSGRVPSQFHTPNFANSSLPPRNCGGSMVGFQEGIGHVNQQGLRQVSSTGHASSNVNCALPMMPGSSEHLNNSINSAVNSCISGRRSLTTVPETDEVCEDQAYNKLVSVSAKNTSLCVLSGVLDSNNQDSIVSSQNKSAAVKTVAASYSNAPLVLLISVSVSPTPTAISVGQPGSTLVSGENLQIHSTSFAGHAIHNNDSILTSPATQIPHNNGDPAFSTSNRSQSDQESSPVTSPSHASFNPTTVSDVQLTCSSGTHDVSLHLPLKVHNPEMFQQVTVIMPQASQKDCSIHPMQT
ncbi:hypothetical protein FEM48_Zijuj01G0072500 [Ziziphus jujuba var. spinosa]|uniref:Uncharacterized protein n=1 Tax=Ziziphus jujuba var. spinosa TaxID=714518 RepID=A0A978VZV5_ZIZJJ|nr:hypothetical protein FEM48_Zijuj01G0072500 [Ziziphus jujuba var. spinosa]